MSRLAVLATVSALLARRGNGAPPRGQILVMFALFMTALIGMLGLAVDVGFAYSQRRTVQNAADAAALAGARAVSKWTLTNPTVSAQPEAEAMAEDEAGNVLGDTDQELVSCDYVNYNVAAVGFVSVGSCALPAVPLTATGVRVRETHDTFLVHAIPGAPDSLTTEAVATAHVELFRAPTAGPFIVCGIGTMLAGSGNNTFSILLPTGTINPLAYGKEYQIHGPQVEDCGAQGSSFNGTTVRSNANDNKHAGDTWTGDTGTQAGPTRFAVNGIQGCAKNLSDDQQNDCVMILPIATNIPTPTKNGNEFDFMIPQLGAFLVKRTGANLHTGTLLANYSITARSEQTWCRPTATLICGGIVVIRLTE